MNNDLTALADELAKAIDQVPGATPNALLVRVYHALRLAAQDQKPVAYFHSHPKGIDNLTRYQLTDADKAHGWVEVPLYSEPPPSAGWNEAIEAALTAIQGLPWPFLIPRGEAAKAIEALRTTPAATKSADAGGGVREALERLLIAAKMLQKNAEGCAVNHHSLDFELQGLPGWLIDTQKDIDAAESALSHQPAPAAANASAELSKFANDLAAKQEPLGVQISEEDLEGMYIRDEPIANDSAEARLRDGLKTARDFIEFYGLDDFEETTAEAIRTIDEALSTHPHASDCDKQGDKPDGLCHCSWGCVEADNCRRKAVTKSEGGVQESPASNPDYNGVKSPALVTAHGLSGQSCPLNQVVPDPSDRTADVTALADAMWQLLDDMGENGQSVCLAAKAQARVAYEAFREDEYADWMPLERAKQILKEAGV